MHDGDRDSKIVGDHHEALTGSSLLPRVSQITLAIGFTSCFSTCQEELSSSHCSSSENASGADIEVVTESSDPQQRPSWNSLHVSGEDQESTTSGPDECMPRVDAI